MYAVCELDAGPNQLVYKRPLPLERPVLKHIPRKFCLETRSSLLSSVSMWGASGLTGVQFNRFAPLGFYCSTMAVEM